MYKYLSVEVLKGKTLISVKVDIDKILFACSDGSEYKMYHNQDCCESVSIEDIDGDLQELIGSPILMAEEISSSEPYMGKPKYPDSFTWTFYRIATVKEFVTIRWLGESNGYYSESVDFVMIKEPNPEVCDATESE